MCGAHRLPYLIVLLLWPALVLAAAVDPLPSWRDGVARRAILEFVTRTTDPASPAFVPLLDRVAVVDHDGTLWPSQPLPAPLRFAIDRVRTQVVDHPEWYRREPYKTVLDADETRAAALGEREIMQMLLATHGGMNSEEFRAVVNQWLATTVHPRFERRWGELAYVPMLELLALLEAHGYRCFIHASGDVEFLRSHVENVYRLPAERVIGNQVKTDYQRRDGRPELLRARRVHLSDERGGKAAIIQHYLGRRPRIVIGNTGSDESMYAWTAAGDGSRLILVLNHDDAGREYLSGNPASVLPAAALPISIKNDWKRLFSGEAPAAAAP